MLIYEGIPKQVRALLHLLVTSKWRFESLTEITLEKLVLMKGNLSCAAGWRARDTGLSN